ncbi:Transcriptional regulator [uncultured Pleomorphomonas sp.]|uniref:Transcriptional regulator n=1 Tax=uncultured Pleomorphomonas sp. TaxID=442121 RepID=A0A212LCL3_9HYPH|nr:LysR family transcriptional regulator [uncultured Pleomorphomonas sp.]SCM75291.1 Transcriptional regulator [uncultured Pleomorphomonas sp.]
MARDLLPSIGALVAFESAARHLSFSRAAAELHLTQGAISRQVRELETRLGLPLFERINQRVFLTDAGEAYRLEVARILAGLSAATERTMASAGGAEVLNLAVLPTFAARWLVPRLPKFLAAHPQASVNFAVRNEPFSFTDVPLDAAIHFGESTWPGAVCEFLCIEEVYPVAAPTVRDRFGLTDVAAIPRAPLLHQSSRPTAWADWFAAEGLPTAGAYRGSRFDQFSMIAEAAVAGLGVALMPRFMIEGELASGHLALLTERPLDAGKAYWFVYPEARVRSRIVRSFGDWLRVEAAVPASPPAGV